MKCLETKKCYQKSIEIINDLRQLYGWEGYDDEGHWQSSFKHPEKIPVDIITRPISLGIDPKNDLYQ
jgi:hypothetical protein